jgi:hypothetical protein
MAPATAASYSRSTPEAAAASASDQFLVGRHNRPTGGQRRFDQIPGRIEATDQFDHDIDIGMRDQALGVSGDEPRRQTGTRTGDVAHGDADEVEAHT